MRSVFFFFLKEEGGIRDVAVTGVQTCALPISLAVWYAGMLFYILHLDPSVIQFRGAALNEFIRNNTILVTTAILMISVFLMDFNTLWLKRYNRDKTWLWIIITTLLVGEIFWSLNFLPHSVAIKSILLVLAYYLLITLGRAHFDGNLNAGLLRRYLYLIAVVLFAVLISARWVV